MKYDSPKTPAIKYAKGGLMLSNKGKKKMKYAKGKKLVSRHTPMGEIDVTDESTVGTTKPKMMGGAKMGYPGKKMGGCAGCGKKMAETGMKVSPETDSNATATNNSGNKGFMPGGKMPKKKTVRKSRKVAKKEQLLAREKAMNARKKMSY